MFVPSSTYRLQLHPGFPFAAALEISEYLARLGTGACYTSPYFAAMPGSTHGYDVCNHNAINTELGGREAHRQFTDRLTALGLGHIVDFVPNHMGIGTEMNAWWRDVLENGPAAAAAIYFDIDWTPVKTALHAKLLLPILGNQYGRVLERGELALKFKDGNLVLTYFEHELPINPKHVPNVLRRATGPLTEILGADSAQLHEFLSILTSLQNLPDSSGFDLAVATERQREKEVARARLARLVSESPQVGEQIEKAVQEVNGEPGKPERFDALHELLEAQSYRLSYWRTASHEINYRRFFDVNTLAGLRVEDPQVFTSTHELLGELLAEHRVQGVRIDHPDGLFDPAKYFRMLQQLAHSKTGKDDELYVVAEKILSTKESLPPKWEVAGTTGYNYLNDLNGIYINGGESRRVRRVYAKLTGRTEPFADVLYVSKRLIMETGMASELSVLAHELARIAESNRRSRDFTLESLKDAITSVVACFPVYRTYVDACGWTPEDRAVVEQAIVRARRRNPAMESSLFDFLREVILPRQPDNSGEDRFYERRDGYPPADADEAAHRLHFAMKLQQYTGPVHAKGLEDTAFYRFNLLLSLNEVGGDAERFGRTLDEFHESNVRRLAQRPFEMLSTATHDTKLGEDTRARVNVLSEIPEQWSREVAKWMRLNRGHRTIVHGDPAPDRNDEYRFYQALIGIWPPDLSLAAVAHRGGEAPPVLTELRERMQAYMMKSVKEAKVHTSWLTPNEEHEAAVTRFVERAMTGPSAAKFLTAFTPLARRVAQIGMVNGLSQVAVKIGSPGVPDFYQGTEQWDLSLVDPDNRRPVDFDRRRQALDDVDRALSLPPAERIAAIAEMVANWPDGRIKQLLTAIGLRLRREEPNLFLAGRYLPLVTDIVVKAGLVAFARVLDNRIALVIAPRLVAPLVTNGQAPLGGDAWKTSRVFLPPELAGVTYRHELTGTEIQPTTSGDSAWLFAGQLFETVPVAIATAAR